jgi:predicted permease
MPAWLYTSSPNGLWVFLLLTLLLGGGMAFVSGRTIAETWRPLWQVPVYMFLLALAVRFMHFALFEEVLMSARNLAVDYGVLLALALAGYKLARSQQMATQYTGLDASRDTGLNTSIVPGSGR